MPEFSKEESEYIRCASNIIIHSFEEQGINVEMALSIILTVLLGFNLSKKDMKRICETLIQVSGSEDFF